MPRDPHPLDEASQEIFNWLNTEPAILADAFNSGYQTPFSAPLNEREKLGYYQRKMYNTRPDGSLNYDSPNEAGREQLIKALGIEGYTQVSAAVLRAKDMLPPVLSMTGAPEPPAANVPPEEGTEGQDGSNSPGY